MTTPILAAAAGVAVVLFVIMAVVATKRADRLAALERERAELKRSVDEAQARIEDRCKLADELRSKLDRAREEAKKAKRKAFDMERSDKVGSTPMDDKRERAQEEALLEARADARRAGQEAERAAEEAACSRDQVEQLKAEIRKLKKTLEDKQDELEQARKGESEETGKLRREIGKLKQKLDSANRRSRTDGQVYRVTNSKLELAMEKIATLEKQLAQRAAASQSEPPSPPAAAQRDQADPADAGEAT